MTKRLVKADPCSRCGSTRFERDQEGDLQCFMCGQYRYLAKPVDVFPEAQRTQRNPRTRGSRL